MAHHFFKSTVQAEAYCPTCGKPTPHHVADGRLGRCMNDHAKPAEAAAVDPGQGSLFETSVFRYE